ncbi:MAG: hypothetical protein NTY30_04020 [Candidatus Berkelbacteria bacterium]|nr:hypothetical protein [Candidatus Berkelbacteria bacterium]
MKKFLIVLACIIVIITLVAGYFGFIPGLSNVMGANKPKDLGVKYTDADLQKGRGLTGVDLQSLISDQKSLDFTGSKNIYGEYTSEIITAMISSAKYKFYPLSNTQVRINADGIVEAAGNFDIDKALKWSADLGGDTSFSREVENYTKYVSNNPSYYLKGKMTVTNNQITLDISEAQISRFRAPQSVINKYQGDLANFVEQKISAVPGMNIKSADFSTGSLKLDATYPAIEKSLK